MSFNFPDVTTVVEDTSYGFNTELVGTYSCYEEDIVIEDATGATVISSRTDGSYGTGNRKATVTYTSTGATIISDRTDESYGADSNPTD